MAARQHAALNPFALVPVTPPPEKQNFRKPEQLQPQPSRPQWTAQHGVFPKGVPAQPQQSRNGGGGIDHAGNSWQPNPRAHVPAVTAATIPAPMAAEAAAQTQATNPAEPSSSQEASHAPNNGATSEPLDPRYVSMVSRIAAYYQQRCQAITLAQQQKCQAWANMHRQKCQDTMQAAMLVVAWYMRDRVQRRRRKQKRAFRTGLRAQAAHPTLARGRDVGRWVMRVPDRPLSPNSPASNAPADADELSFAMGREDTAMKDKDAELFEMADQLIKSQYRAIEVPFLGMLSLDESDSESEKDDDKESGVLVGAAPRRRVNLPKVADAAGAAGVGPGNQEEAGERCKRGRDHEDSGGDGDEEDGYYDYDDDYDEDADFEDGEDDGADDVYSGDAEGRLDSQMAQRNTTTGPGSRSQLNKSLSS